MNDIRIKIKKFKKSKECEDKNLFDWPKEEQERFFKKVADDFSREMRVRWKEIELAKKKEVKVLKDK